MTTWMNLQGIMLHGISQTERQILYNCTYMWNLEKKKKKKTVKTETLIDTENILVMVCFISLQL